jgi:hypothetical protein
MTDITNPNRPSAPLSPEEEQQIRATVFRNSPGSSQYISLREDEIISGKAEAEAQLKRQYSRDPARLRRELKALDEETARRLRQVHQTRPRVRPGEE